MTMISSTPLAALAEYYRRLESDPVVEIASFGFGRELIDFQLVLEADGRVAQLSDIRELTARGQSTRNSMIVPDRGGRSSGIKPFFCWDNTGYVLGADAKEKPSRAAEMFAAFREFHFRFEHELATDEGFTVLCAFLRAWDPAKVLSLPGWQDAAGLNVVFKIRGADRFIHQSSAVRGAWFDFIEREIANDSVDGDSLVSGEREPIARLHPLIKGTHGAKPSGAAIVSFNATAFTSYGWSQSFNAPVGVRDTFRYTTALDYLLNDPSRRVQLGDATTVFWTGRPDSAAAEEVFGAFFGNSSDKFDAEPAENNSTVDRVRGFLQAAKHGRLIDAVDDPEAPFYVLGLSPNASRLNVRFWFPGTIAQFADRLVRYATDLEMVGAAPDDPPITISALLDETVSLKKAKRNPKKREPDRAKVIPGLAGDVARAILAGTDYPQQLLASVIRRIRCEGFVSSDRIDQQAAEHRRAAILRAFLVRNRHWEVPVALNKDHPDEACHLGRLFAALEKTQEEGAGKRKLNSTIKDRYFGSASTTPAAIFPVLLKLHPHHIEKIDNPGRRVNLEKLVGEICSHINAFPLTLRIEEQGLFHIAYYHQRQDFFTVRDDAQGAAT